MKKTINIQLWISLLTLFPLSLLLAQPNWNNYDLLAHYPLIENTDDLTGNTNGFMAKNIDFSRGAAYSNGIYLESFEDGCLLETPSIESLELSNFGFSLEVQFDTIYNVENPIINAGNLNRYITLYFDIWQGYVKLSMVKNYGEVKIVSDTLLDINQWYKIDFLHSNDTSFVYLNDKLLIKHFGSLEFYGQEEDYNTKVFSNTHSGDGKTFRGLWRNLKIYTANPSSIKENAIANNIILYPNPAYNELKINFDKPVDIDAYQIIDMTGRVVKYQPLHSSIENLELNINHLQKGMYILQVHLSQNETKYFSFVKS